MTSPAFDALVTGAFRSGLDYEFWPAVNAAAKKILIVLHGRGDSREGFHWLPEALALDEFNYLFLNAPDTYSGGYSWYALAPAQGPGIVRSRALLTELVAGLRRELGVKPADIFFLGFSQGCLMCLDLALRAEDMFGGVVGISGYIYFLEQYPAAFGAAARAQRILMTHGHRDEVLGLAETKASVEKLRSLGAHIDWREFDKAHSIEEHSELPELRAFFTRLLELC